MTCKCGNEYCWMCLRRWASHNYATCVTIPESTHELRSSSRNRLHNKAINHRRERNFPTYSLFSGIVRQSKSARNHHDILLSTYIDMNTMAEFLYVLLQRRRIDTNIRSVLVRTARQLELNASTLKTAVEGERLNMKHVEQMRMALTQTLTNLIYMKKQQVIL